jgi:RHS repeat-associated protein
VGLSEQIHDLDRVTYTYNTYGQVLVMKDLEGQTENHYSISGQLSEVTRINQTVTLNSSFVETNRVEVSRNSVRYEMDKWDNQTKLIYPDASVISKTYDVLNRLQSVTDITGTTNYAYHTNDRKVVETRPNGDVKTTLTEWGKVTSLVSTRYDAMLETDVVVFEQSLNYDESGNVIHEVRKLNDDITTISNEYNKRGELTKSTQVNGSTTTVYTYLISPYGNKSEVIDVYQDDILHSTTKAYVYNHLNQLESLTVGLVESEFEYDEYGNLILETNGSSSKTYSYDLNNRLIEAVEEGQTLQFTYDGNGNRLTKSISSTVVQYVNDTTIENEQVLSYKVGSDVTNLSYGLTRLNEDAIGYLSDSYGNIVQHGSETYAYTPYGELTQGIINGVNEAGYKGEVHDTSSLQYLRARTYNTKLKQFLQEDTYVGKDSHPLSQNRYAFVLKNSINYYKCV